MEIPEKVLKVWTVLLSCLALGFGIYVIAGNTWLYTENTRIGLFAVCFTQCIEPPCKEECIHTDISLNGALYWITVVFLIKSIVVLFVGLIVLVFCFMKERVLYRPFRVLIWAAVSGFVAMVAFTIDATDTSDIGPTSYGAAYALGWTSTVIMLINAIIVGTLVRTNRVQYRSIT